MFDVDHTVRKILLTLPFFARGYVLCIADFPLPGTLEAHGKYRLNASVAGPMKGVSTVFGTWYAELDLDSSAY